MSAIAIFLLILYTPLCFSLQNPNEKERVLHQAQIAIGGQTVAIEVADTWEARKTGLMGRKHLPPNTGMLFVFESPQTLAFWMKDTLIPLTIAFFDEKKKLIETVDMPLHKASAGQPPLYESSRPSLYALEVPLNWFREKGIEKGMEFSFLDSSHQLQ